MEENNKLRFEEQSPRGHFKVYDDKIEIEYLEEPNVYIFKYKDIEKITILQTGPAMYNTLSILLEDNKSHSFLINYKAMETWKLIVDYISKYNSKDGKKEIDFIDEENGGNLVQVTENVRGCFALVVAAFLIIPVLIIFVSFISSLLS